VSIVLFCLFSSTAVSSESSGDESDEPLVKKKVPPAVSVTGFIFLCFL